MWDLRAQALLAVVANTGGSGGGGARGKPGRGGGSGGGQQVPQVTAAAWLGGGPRGDFATGHVNGDVLVWALPRTPDGAEPASAARTAPGGAAAAGGGAASNAVVSSLAPRLLSRLRVAPPGAAAHPVSCLSYLVSQRAESLLVAGGGGVEAGPGLALLALPLPTEVGGVHLACCTCTFDNLL